MQMELRYQEVDRARGIYERYVLCIPSVKAWVRYAKFEMQNGEVGLARKCYERAVEELGEDGETVCLPPPPPSLPSPCSPSPCFPSPCPPPSPPHPLPPPFDGVSPASHPTGRFPHLSVSCRSTTRHTG